MKYLSEKIQTAFVLILFLVVIFTASCSVSENKTIIDAGSRKKELIGTCTRDGFEKAEYKSWFKEEYSGYIPKKEITNELKDPSLYNNLKIKIIFGTWCSDSRRELPRFYKIVDSANIPQNIISLTAVDTKKFSRDKNIDGISFKRIPTFIFYKSNKEAGRITERPEKSLEEDMLNILSSVK